LSTEDRIKDLFAEKLASHEAPVNPELWTKISSQIATPAAAAASTVGKSVLTKSIIGIASAIVVSTGIYLMFSNEEKTQVAQQQEINDSADVLDEILLEKEKSATEVKPQVNLNEEGDNDQPNQLTEESMPKSVNDQPKTVETTQVKDQYTSPTFLSVPNPNLIEEEPKRVEQPIRKDELITKSRTEEQTVNQTQKEAENSKYGFEITKLPNVFVLNATGYFSIPFNGETTDFQFTILDSKNNVIFRADHPDFEWRGTDLSGNIVEPGNYIYIITAKDNLGNSINKYSPLTVINQ